MAACRSTTKILPSPILPVRAPSLDGGDHIVGAFVGHGHFDLQLGDEGDGVFRAAIDFLVALLAAIAAHFGHGHAFDAERRSASRTASSRCGWMMAMTSFMTRSSAVHVDSRFRHERRNRGPGSPAPGRRAGPIVQETSFTMTKVATTDHSRRCDDAFAWTENWLERRPRQRDATCAERNHETAAASCPARRPRRARPARRARRPRCMAALDQHHRAVTDDAASTPKQQRRPAARHSPMRA